MNNVTWAFTEATRLVSCTACRTPAGVRCVDEDDHKLLTLHPERLDAYRQKIGDADYALRHGRRTP